MIRKYNRYNIEIVKNTFNNEGYELISTEYINPHIKLKYLCPNSHKHKISWNKWLYGRRCPYCSRKIKYKLSDIKTSFENEGYVLLTNVYINVFTKLKYKCNKGHIGSITWHNWKHGARCLKCKYENMLMENNPNWKGGISCEPYCFEWSSKEFKDFIKERDGYQCLNPDCWKTSKRLSVHHIDYNKKNCEPSNLITLCTSCNSRANKDREWHEAWYSMILQKRYNYQEITNEE